MADAGHPCGRRVLPGRGVGGHRRHALSQVGPQDRGGRGLSGRGALHRPPGRLRDRAEPGRGHPAGSPTVGRHADRRADQRPTAPEERLHDHRRTRRSDAARADRLAARPRLPGVRGRSLRRTRRRRPAAHPPHLPDAPRRCAVRTNPAAHRQAWPPAHQGRSAAHAALAGADLPRIHLTSRMLRDAALCDPAPPRTGKPGRPRTKGARLPTPPELAVQVATQHWQAVTVDVRGQQVARLVYVRDVLWYGACPKRPVRLVIVRDPDGIEPDDFFLSTDPAAIGPEIASRYAGRWSIEVTFRDTKQDLGGENPQSWKRQGPERAACLALWLHGLTWCWYLGQHPRGDTWIPRPWYPREASPSFLDALAALRRLLWSQRITALSAAATTAHDKTKITEALLDTLAYAA